MNQNHEPQQFTTESIDLAAWLWTNGFTPEAVPSTDSRKVDFVFDSSPELDAAVVVFLKGEARVNPASFELLKTQLHRKIRAVRGRS